MTLPLVLLEEFGGQADVHRILLSLYGQCAPCTFKVVDSDYSVAQYNCLMPFC
jgi:hypothetical protein